MNIKKISLAGLAFVVVMAIATPLFDSQSLKGGATATPTRALTSAPKATKSPTSGAPTLTRTASPTITATALASATTTGLPPTFTFTPPAPSMTPGPSPTTGALIAPYPSAPLCPSHDSNVYHGLWDAVRGCHYDHEHGDNPFTPEVAAMFPGFDLHALLCGVEISHCNPSSPMENTMKHGGFKWQVDLNIPCEVFEGASRCIVAAIVEFHDFGDPNMELEVRVHSALALIKSCDPSNLSDCQYSYTPQHVDYGQRVSQYQGDLMPYTESAGCLLSIGCQANPIPAYDKALGPYNTIDRFGDCVGCRASLRYVVDHQANANGVWTSKNGPGVGPIGSSLLGLLFRVRDMYELKDNADNAYPFTFGWLCSSDGGAHYNPAGCRYTNSTARVHEVVVTIPPEWDGLEGFDTNPAVGRITAEGFVTRFGELDLSCLEAGGGCFPIKLVNAFVGKSSGALPGQKISNPTPVSNPSRNIWFCAGVVCSETSAGAVPSGWIGPSN